MDKTLHDAPARRGGGRPADGKVRVTIRLDPAVVDAFKASGKGWQARINTVLLKVTSGALR